MVRNVSLTLALLLLTLTLSETKVYGQIPSPRSYLFVEIRDTSGQPVTDADIAVSGADGKQISSGRSSPNEARIYIHFPIRTDHHYNVLVSKQGFQPSEHVFFPVPSSHGSALVEKMSIGYTGESTNIILRKFPTTESERKAFGAQELQSQFILAAKRGDSLKISKMLQTGVAADTVDADGTPALLWASFAGDADTINILLEGGAHVRTKNPLSPKALLIFFLEGIPRDQKRIKSNATDTGEIYKRESAVFNLIKAGADVNAKDSYFGTTLSAALRAVPDALRTVAVEALISAGANVNTADEAAGSTPLMWASQSGSSETVKILLAAGAQVNAKNKWGQTPLMFAALGARPEIIGLLLANGAKASINARDHSGQTALLHASYYSSFDFKPEDQLRTVKALIDAGADVNIKDNSGRTPLTLAQEHSRNEAVIQLLKSKQKN